MRPLVVTLSSPPAWRIIALASDDKNRLKMKWVGAAILAGAGIWVGATVAFLSTGAGTEWKWISAAILVQAIIVAGAILIPKFRPKMLLGAAVAAFMTGVAIALLLPHRFCLVGSEEGWSYFRPQCFDLLWVRIFVAGVGLVVGLILASLARERRGGGARTYGLTQGPAEGP
jgi:hypothetical protein